MRHTWALVAMVTSIVTAVASCGSNRAGHGTSASHAAGGHAAGGGGSTGDGVLFGGGGPSDGGKCAEATTCAEQHATCGDISDGCGGVLHCGGCAMGQSCVDGACTKPCAPMSCSDLGLECGPAGDGCGNQIDCGACTGNDTCGGGGTPGQCGHGSSCPGKTCVDLGISCGPAGDGCGNQLDCGTCTGAATCGGGGTPGKCGIKVCVPTTCAQLGDDCGAVADGCGGLLQCGTCSGNQACGASVANHCGIPATCTNLCLKQVACSSPSVTTTVSGTVYAPNGVDPLLNALVYVPNAAVQPFAPGVSCDNCGAAASGSPLVRAVTDTHGHFQLQNVPVGTSIPLVIQLGRWRRQITIAGVSACADNPLPASQTRLPRNKSEGDIPLMAFSTGSVDALECVMRKIGIDDGEFTVPYFMGGSGRVQIFTGWGSGGATINGDGMPTDEQLWTDPAVLAHYDMVLFPCQGYEFDQDPVAQQNLVHYANAGGRIFATHYSYVWLYDASPFSGTASWSVNTNVPVSDQTGFINATFPKGQALAQWLLNVGASTTLGQIPLQVLRKDTSGVLSPTQSWMSVQSPSVPMHFTFNTPLNAPASAQCGRVLFDDFHVENAYADPYFTPFPQECAGGPMTPQEKLLEFMIFDLGSCISSDVPSCTPKTCAQQNIGCGPAGDGCGNVIQCGACQAPQTCGGGGTPSQCGEPTCTTRTCLQQGIQCGPAGDGCGGLLQCGTCPSGQTCGGGGMPGICGNQTCTPKSCAQLGIQCGPAGDGCGGLLQCGACQAPQTCGGGGMPGVCGGGCTPKTCAQQGFNCGPVGDGCGNIIQCGTCQAPQTCGGGGKANVCGGGGPA